MDFLFQLAILLLPFENLFFAPSGGWATIAPLIFALYVIMNSNYILKVIKENRFLFICFITLYLLSFLNFLIISFDFGNFLSASITLILGVLEYIAFYIFFVIKKRSFKKIIKYILISYSIALIIGIIQFIVYKMQFTEIIRIIQFLQKRDYNKVQFSFTEPSFISMHLYGVLLPIYFFIKDKRILRLIIIFAIFALLFDASTRMLIDTLAVIAIVTLFKVNFRKLKNIFVITVMAIISLFIFTRFYENNTRFQSIVDQGIYADGSLASRYFRINASIKGYQQDTVHFFFGSGLGNAIRPLRIGYNDALNEYDNWFMSEVIMLGNPSYTHDSVALCLYIRMISEFGIIFTFIFFAWVISQAKTKDDRMLCCLMLYVYIQFDSYAFYSLWLYLTMMKRKRLVGGESV